MRDFLYAIITLKKCISYDSKFFRIGEESKKGPYMRSGEVASLATVVVLDLDNIIEHITATPELSIGNPV